MDTTLNYSDGCDDDKHEYTDEHENAAADDGDDADRRQNADDDAGDADRRRRTTTATTPTDDGDDADRRRGGPSSSAEGARPYPTMPVLDDLPRPLATIEDRSSSSVDGARSRLACSCSTIDHARSVSWGGARLRLPMLVLDARPRPLQRRSRLARACRSTVVGLARSCSRSTLDSGRLGKLCGDLGAVEIVGRLGSNPPSDARTRRSTTAAYDSRRAVELVGQRNSIPPADPRARHRRSTTSARKALAVLDIARGCTCSEGLWSAINWAQASFFVRQCVGA